MEGGLVVSSRGAEGEEVLLHVVRYVCFLLRCKGRQYLCCLGDGFAEDLDLQVTVSGV